MDYNWIMTCVITQNVALENPNRIHKCVTQMGVPITVTLIDTPVILVKDKSNTRDASRVNLGGLQWDMESDKRVPL